MAALTKTQGTVVLALQSISSNAVLISNVQDVTTKLAASIFIHFGRRVTTALAAAVNIRVEASAKSSGDGFWFPLAIFSTGIALAEAETVTGTVAAGVNVITCSSTTNLVVGDLIYIDNGTIANSEWARIKAVATNVSVTVEDNLVNAQTGSAMYDQAEMFIAQLDLTGVGRLRIVVDASGSGQAVAVEALMVSGDSIG